MLPTFVLHLPLYVFPSCLLSMTFRRTLAFYPCRSLRLFRAQQPVQHLLPSLFCLLVPSASLFPPLSLLQSVTHRYHPNLIHQLKPCLALNSSWNFFLPPWLVCFFAFPATSAFPWLTFRFSLF